MYPQIPEHELRNFLIYVHGDTKKARERLAACVAWRQMHLPIRKEEIQQPLKQGLFFFHGQDVAGRPVGYFRLLNHDRKKRSIEEHVKVCWRMRVCVCAGITATAIDCSLVYVDGIQ